MSATAFSFADYLRSIREQGLLRQLKEIDPTQGALVKLEGKELVNFSSNDYLGLARSPRLIGAMHNAVDKYGVGSGASQLICGRSSAHVQLENSLARFLGRERVIVFSSGYLANIAVTSVLLRGRDDVVYEDRLNHASIVDSANLSNSKLKRYSHADVESLCELMTKQKTGRKLVYTDTVFSMDGDVAPLKDIAKHSAEQRALLVVDDAHGFGVLGDRGRGVLELCKLKQDDVPLLVVTFGKALGASGACIAGRKEIIEVLIQRARPFIYSTALPPAIAATVCEGLKIINDEAWRRRHLLKLIEQFSQGAAKLGLPIKHSFTPIQPVIAGDAAKTIKISNELQNQGFLLTAIRPPTVPKNTSRLRVTLTSEHSTEQVSNLLDALSSAFRKVEQPDGWHGPQTS